MSHRLEKALEASIFWSRWLQAPLYVGLIIVQIVYCWKFGVELLHLVHNVFAPTASGATASGNMIFMLGVLELIDIVMVANLITMVVIGGYATFVSKLDLHDHADRPDWLKHIDPGSIKVKLAGSLIGISSIHLLQSFINLERVPLEHVRMQLMIHVVFLFSTLLLASTEMIMARRHRPGEIHAIEDAAA